MKKAVLFSAVVFHLVLADAVTKEIAERLLASGDSVNVIPGFFDLVLVHNRGCAWGMFQGQVWPLAVFGILAMAFLIWKRKSVFGGSFQFTIFNFRYSIAETLLYAGIVGNVLDRLFRGYVVDMFDFHWKNAYHYPCFNVADTFICVAAGLLILSSLLEKKADGKSEK